MARQGSVGARPQLSTPLPSDYTPLHFLSGMGLSILGPQGRKGSQEDRCLTLHSQDAMPSARCRGRRRDGRNPLPPLVMVLRQRAQWAEEGLVPRLAGDKEGPGSSQPGATAGELRQCQAPTAALPMCPSPCDGRKLPGGTQMHMGWLINQVTPPDRPSVETLGEFSIKSCQRTTQHMHMHACTCVHTCTHAHVHACTHARACMHTHTHACMRTHTCNSRSRGPVQPHYNAHLWLRSRDGGQVSGDNLPPASVWQIWAVLGKHKR